jgi:hypothetical protein
MRYEFQPLSAEESARWGELIIPYQGCELFHRPEWLEYLATSRQIEFRSWAIRDGSKTIGYFSAGLICMGPFKIMGSPLRGWGTNFMGPVVNADVDQEALLRSLDALAAREHLAMTEIESRILQDQNLVASHYEPSPSWTYLVPLTADHNVMWLALDSTRRTGIRKAIKAGLSVEDTDDPSLADQFYDQYTHVMRRKGESPPYPRAHPRLLVKHLKKADLLFALRVRDDTGRVLATGLFPHDDKTIYFWGGASSTEALHLCPNDLLHWSAMCMAADRGLCLYNMSGHGRFKMKFGGTLTELKRWHKFHWWSARWARRGYELLCRERKKLPGKWQRLTGSRAPGVNPGTGVG